MLCVSDTRGGSYDLRLGESCSGAASGTRFMEMGVSLSMGKGQGQMGQRMVGKSTSRK